MAESEHVYPYVIIQTLAEDCILAEATPSKLWATGMSPFVTEHTAPKFWPGKNLLGSMLTAMAQHLTSPSETESTISQSQGDSLDTPLAQSSEAFQPVEPRGPMENMSENPSCNMDANTTDIHDDVSPNLNQPSANPVKPPVKPSVKPPELTPVTSSGGPFHLSI